MMVATLTFFNLGMSSLKRPYARLRIFLNEKITGNEFILSHYFSFFSFFFSILIIVSVWYFSERYFFNQAQNKFEHYVNQEANTLKNRLQEYENTLHSGVGFFEASDEVTRTDWYRFVKSINLKRYCPGIQGMGYSMVIPPSKLDMTIDKIRREGYTSFDIKPKGQRELYTAIVYLEPLDRRNKAAIGYDMFSEPVRREAMERARDSGKPTLSGKVTLVQEIDKNIQAGVLMYLPYYAEDTNIDTLENRRKELLGYVYAPFRMGDFIKANFTHNAIMNIEIYDGAKREEKNLLYTSNNTSTYASEHHAHRIIDVGGRSWHIYYSSTADFDAHNNSLYPILFAMLGLIMYLFMALIIVELLKKRLLLKRSTENLRNEKNKAHGYLDIVEVMVLVLDTQFKIQLINRRGCEIIGYTAEEAIGKNFFELFIPQRIHEQLRNVAYHIMENANNTFEYYENPIQTKSGEERLIAWRNRVLKDESGKVIGFLSSGEDITEIRRAQDQLQESEEFYRTVVGAIEESIVILHNNTVVDCNDLALRLFDMSRETFIGESIFDTVYEIECKDDLFENYLLAALKGEFISKRCTFRLRTNPNHIKIVECSFSPFTLNGENKIVMISRDITQKVEEEKFLALHGRQAQMGEMISMIAHQWRQPLAIINAITTQMRLKAMISETADNDFVDNLVKIEQQSAHLSQTISDYRDFFRPDKPKERFYVLSLIKNALNLIDHTLKNHSIHIDMGQSCNPLLYTYRNELLQVILVLLKNAMDAFMDNGITRGEITIHVHQKDNFCIISIRDNGGGIPKEIMYKLFSPYFTTKNETYGTGLGLYMSRIIIEDHCDGHIEASSIEMTTTFTITIPCEGDQCSLEK